LEPIDNGEAVREGNLDLGASMQLKCLISRVVDRSNIGLAVEAVGSRSLLGTENFSVLCKRAGASIQP
jgi:hypothetical protein